MASPALTVCVPSHDRPDRLHALLHALELQTLPAERFEVVVCHDSTGPETDAVLDAHAGRVTVLREPPDSCGPARKRNRAWREGTAPVVVFTDDDCRPTPTWLQELLAVAQEHEGAVVTGTTRPDPEEAHLLGHPYARSQHIDPPAGWGQTCNIAYPRELLERLGGFDEEHFGVVAGEDTDLLMRALETGAAHVAAPAALTYHAVDTTTLRGRVRSTWRWQHGVLALQRHPELRGMLHRGVFWRPAHGPFLLAAAGVATAAATRRALPLALALPYLRTRVPRYGRAPRQLAAAARDTAGLAVVDAVEVATMASGSVRYRTLVL